MALRVLVTSLTVLLLMSARGQGQVPPTTSPTGPASGPCASEYDSSLDPTCVQPTGLKFTNLLYLVSDKIRGTAPEGKTLEQFRQELCSDRNQDIIVPCMLKLMVKYVQNDTRCSDQEKAMIDQSGKELLMVMEGKCVEPCEREGMAGMLQCFMAAQIDPGKMLNSTITEDKFSMLGKSSEEAKRYCDSASRLFPCMKQIRASCPAIQDQLNVMGWDIDAMETASTLLCSRQQNYLAALQCFSRPSQAVAGCRQQTAATVNRLVFARYASGDVTPSKFIENLCRVRVQQVNCELQGYSSVCEAQHNSLRTALECSVLPSPCRLVDRYQISLGARCQAVTISATPNPAVPRTTSRGGFGPPPPMGGVNPTRATNNLGQSGNGGNGGNGGNAASSLVPLSAWSLGPVLAAALLLPLSLP